MAKQTSSLSPSVAFMQGCQMIAQTNQMVAQGIQGIANQLNNLSGMYYAVNREVVDEWQEQLRAEQEAQAADQEEE